MDALRRVEGTMLEPLGDRSEWLYARRREAAREPTTHRRRRRRKLKQAINYARGGNKCLANKHAMQRSGVNKQEMEGLPTDVLRVCLLRWRRHFQRALGRRL